MPDGNEFNAATNRSEATEIRSAVNPRARRRRRARQRRMILICVLVAIAAVIGLELAKTQHKAPRAGSPTGSTYRCQCRFFRAQLADQYVRVFNASNYSSPQLEDLIRIADRGMATHDPTTQDVAGQMHHGDLVVATRYALYWIDSTTRGGLIAGEWPLRPARSRPAFSFVTGRGWAPNLLLPGSDGTNVSGEEGDAGLGVRLLASGGTDASVTPGRGTFDPIGPALLVRFERSGNEYSFTYSGELTQEYNGTHTVRDAEGDTAIVDYRLTYSFFGSQDSRLVRVALPRSHLMSQQRINLVGVTLTPEQTAGPCLSGSAHCIHLEVFDVGDDLQYVPSTQDVTDRYVMSTAKTLQSYGSTCPGTGEISARQFAALCMTVVPGAITYIQGGTSLPVALSPGDEALFCSAKCVRSIAYIHEPDSLMPARDSFVYNRVLNVVAAETQYFNVTDPVQTWTQGQNVRTLEGQIVG